ncbi:hypothetical protein F2P81_014085 [Scophthalmus maximus]|uniref:Uncharacterized protein n=1 Tax=Scophthalmus maximus TaxID=52904 RepID=A0A6A4SMY5_SCOMX|nr:hypothetical protein F2P81_014085 [Scophthalmus maximus]
MNTNAELASAAQRQCQLQSQPINTFTVRRCAPSQLQNQHESIGRHNTTDFQVTTDRALTQPRIRRSPEPMSIDQLQKAESRLPRWPVVFCGDICGSTTVEDFLLHCSNIF